AQDLGAHEVLIEPRDLPLGEYQFELIARTPDGQEETREGIVNSRADRRDPLTLAHTFVKGVDLYSGGAVIGESDIAVGGRGPGLRLERSYASHSGDQVGFFGRGWSADLDGQVQVDDCGQRIVVGPGGQGQRFSPSGQLPDGTQTFTAQFGYHGTLLQRGDVYDFYAKDGTHFHYAQADLKGPRLSFVEDTNGNRVTYSWEVTADQARVSRISDSAGRSIDLVYEQVVAERESYGIRILDSYTLLREARGPDGLVVLYTYDNRANLTDVIRTDGSGEGQRHSQYTYDDLGGLILSTPEGRNKYVQFGFRLKTARDAISGATRRYDYALGWSAFPFGSGSEVDFLPEQRVITLTEADLGTTRFVYPELRGVGPVSTVVTDARLQATTYALNRQGAVEVQTDPIGTTTTTQWNLLHRQPDVVTDGLGTQTSYTYDNAGNKLTEHVSSAHGLQDRSWTYYPSDAFVAPFIKDRVATATDARQIITRYAYDDRGNPITVERGGVTTHDAYAVNGDRTSHTDGEGQVWQFRYDTYGQLVETESPLRDVSASTYDRRGRRLTQTDANGNTTRWTYDARDRVLTTALPGGANETRAYTDSARTVTITNPRGVITRQEFDLMGRLERETVADDTRTRDYDKNGNLVAETDFGGHATTYVYDAVNRLEYTRQAGDDGTLRTTHVTYDALGHVLSETIGAGATGDGDARRTEYRYEHPSYARTLVRRELIDDSGSRWLEDSTTYDANGNPRLSRDAEGRVTERTFDDRDRLITEAGPLGRTTTLTYDGRDLKRSERRSNAGGSGAQVREWRYDAAGRLQDSVDAEGGVRSQTYDGVGNVTSRSDARGNTVRYRYDARNNVIEERGPAPDQFTSYGYDANNNRTRETFANGRELSHSYDGRDRRHVSSDGDGHVETRTWTPDGLPDTVTDADGRVTRSFHDALHRLVREELPGPGQRRRTYGHTIHGDVERITDALGRVTRQEYDTLGRRTATTYPAVAGETAVTRTRYDAVGNVVAEVNGRGQTTTYEVNALNRRTAQVDPLPCEAGGSGTCRQTWTYDTEGNVLTHTDRRGVLSVSAYDRENRLVGQARDGLVVQTLEHDAQGNVIAQWDALSRETRFTYDTANRKTQTLTANRAREDWTYTPLGDIATHTDADRRTTAYTYTKRRYLESESLAGETTRYTYDGAGHPLSRQRPTGEAATWRYTYDTAGRLQTVQDPLANTTTFGYDSVDNRTQVTDANQRTTVFTYDARNRLTGKTYPGGGSWTWTYDADSNRTASEAPNGRVTQTTYDALSRPTLSTYVAAPAGEVQTTAWAYDGNGNLRRVAETTDGTTRTETRTYDPFDRLTDVTNGDGRHLTYRYDDVGNRTELTDHDGQTTVWSYDDLNHNTAISLPGLGITRQTHTAAGRLESITRPDGAESIYTYNDTGRLETLLHRKAGQPIASYTYRYDPNGNRLIQEESNGPVSANTTQLTRYTYDDADRLTQVDEPGRTTVYTLDPVGNREHERVTDGAGTLISDSTLTYNLRDQLTNRNDPIASIQLTQTWDDNGNLATQLVNGGTPRVYTYDARDRMKALSLGNGTTLHFTYHADGLRREKTD
ncbi:DUF6531 domain-containing protein, partial [Tahibacter harae]